MPIGSAVTVPLQSFRLIDFPQDQAVIRAATGRTKAKAERVWQDDATVTVTGREVALQNRSGSKM